MKSNMFGIGCVSENHTSEKARKQSTLALKSRCHQKSKTGVPKKDLCPPKLKKKRLPQSTIYVHKTVELTGYRTSLGI